MKKDEATLIRIDAQKCSACELCAFFCPCHVIHMVFDTDDKEYAKVAEETECIECFKCIDVCESKAIYL